MIYKDNINIKLEPIELPKTTWTMSIGNYYINHTTPYSYWRAFWLRFMGWKVIRSNNK